MRWRGLYRHESAGRGVDHDVGEPRRGSDSGRLPGRLCEPDYDTDCASEAAEFAGTVQVEEGCVLIDDYYGGLFAVLFPHGVSWSSTDNGIVTSDGDVAHPGEWIYGGGGTSPLVDLDVLDLTDEQRSDIKRCVAASDEPEKYWEMGANDSITRIDGPPDF